MCWECIGKDCGELESINAEVRSDLESRTRLLTLIFRIQGVCLGRTLLFYIDTHTITLGADLCMNGLSAIYLRTSVVAIDSSVALYNYRFATVLNSIQYTHK